jgi:hypothetical protein
MRRFLIWSGLAVVIGLVLAIGGYLAYDHFYARFQPVTITRNQGEIQRLLDESSWVSSGAGGDQPLYIIGYRDSAPTRAYEQQEAEKLRAGGVDVRVILFARPDKEGAPQSTPAERATLAELWLTRDWGLYQRWTATPSKDWTAAGIPLADGNLARSAVVEAGRQFMSRFDALMRDAGVKPTFPLVIWRDREGFLKACACADSRSWAFIRDDLDAPEAVEAAPALAPEVPMTPAPAVQPGVQPQVQGLPYPTLPPIPPTAGQTTPTPAPTPAAPTQTPSAAPARPAPSNTATSRPVPQTSPRPAPRQNSPRQTRPPAQEDTQFY